MTTQVSESSVVGRDVLIRSMWRKLSRGSLRFTAERRIGKTTVMQKMEAEASDGFRVVFLDVEGIDSPTRLAEALLTKVKALLSKKDKAHNTFNAFLDALGGVEIGGLIKLERTSLDWRSMLDKAIDGICVANEDTKLVLMFDELPYMLQKIAVLETRRGTPESAALDILDILRAKRMQHGNLRMVFAGSVGLHHVLDTLRGAGVATEPVNDMPRQEIGPLDRDDAIALAKRLLAVEKAEVPDDGLEPLAVTIADLTDRVPFYIERVVARLAESPQSVTPQTAREVVDQHLTGDDDAWQMEHFRSRLQIYYTGAFAGANGREIHLADLAAAVLDHVALADQSLSIDQVWGALKAQFAVEDRARIVQLLRSLALDHYLTTDKRKRYSFRFPLVRRWWVLAQGLAD